MAASFDVGALEGRHSQGPPRRYYYPRFFGFGSGTIAAPNASPEFGLAQITPTYASRASSRSCPRSCLLAPSEPQRPALRLPSTRPLLFSRLQA